MRKPKKLSTTSLHLFEVDREEFYLKYMSENRPEREPQSAAMAVGSSFDAFVKSSLHHHIFGDDGGGEYALRTLFENQVSNEEIRDWVWRAGEYAFQCYRIWGCYDELLEMLLQSEEPRFEFELTGEIGGVPLIGYPDMTCIVDTRVVLDWKVNNFCSKSGKSPAKLYRTCRDCWGGERAKPTRGGGQPKPHKQYNEINHCGHYIGDHFLEQADKKWADQTSIYSWLLGVEVGDEDFIACIDQLCCKPTDSYGHPLIRAAQHRSRISRAYQEGLLKRLQYCWSTVQSGHVFDDLSREDSDLRCETLDMEQPIGDDEFWGSLKEKKWG